MSGARLLSWIALALTVLCAVLVVAADSSVHAAHLVIAWTGRTFVARQHRLTVSARTSRSRARPA